jgi:hypothetical protein
MATKEELAEALKAAHAAGDVEAARKLADAYSSTSSQPSMSMPKQSMVRQFGQGISDIGSGVMKAGSDIIRGVQQVTGLGDEDVLAEAQKQHDAEYAPVSARSPFLSAAGEAAPAAPIGGGLLSTALKIAGLEGSKYGDATDRAQRAGTAGAMALAVPGLMYGTAKVASKINQPFKQSNDPNLSLMRELADKHDILLDAAQYTGNKSLQNISALLDDLPFTSTLQAEKQAAQREAWQEALFTQGGENKPWSYNLKNPTAISDDLERFKRPTSTPEATRDFGAEAPPKEIGFMEQYNKTINAPTGKDIIVPRSLQKYDHEPEFLGGAAGGRVGNEDDIVDGVFRETGTGTMSGGVTRHDMPASKAVHPQQDVMNAMKYRLNTQYRDINLNNKLTVDKDFHNRLVAVRESYNSSELPSDIVKMVRSKVSDLLDVPVGTEIPGRVYQNIRSKLDDNMSTYKGNATAYNAFKSLRDLLDDKMKAGMSPEYVSKLNETNKDWLVMRTIQESIDHNQGTIAPKPFFNNLLKQDKTKARTVYGKGEQDLVELSKIGTHFIRPKKDTVTAWSKYPWAKGLTLVGATTGGGLLVDADTTKNVLGAAAAGGALATGAAAYMQKHMWKPNSYPVSPLVEKDFPRIKKGLKGVGKSAPVISYLNYLMGKEGE